MKFISLLLFFTLAYSKAQTCDFLDKNQVKANICTNNDKFWDINGTQNHSYEVPKGSLRHTQFANSIWIVSFISPLTLTNKWVPISGLVLSTQTTSNRIIQRTR